MRAYELARELGVESKEVLARAAELGITISSASSGLDEETVAFIRLAFEESATAGKAAAETAPEAAPAAAPPPPPEQRGGRGSGRHHPAHRRLSGAPRRPPDHLCRHPGARGFHRAASARGRGHRHRRAGGGGVRRGGAA